MIIHHQPNGIRLTGKAWQIRAWLRQLARHRLTLKQFLETPKRKKPLY
jgi:hypothetical protein